MTIYDERHVLFSRIKLKPNTKEYESFYRENKTYQHKDDLLRNKSLNDALKNKIFLNKYTCL